MVGRNPKGCSNGQLSSASLRHQLALTAEALNLWEQALQQRQLSARAGDRLLRVAQTISDLDGTDTIGPSAIAEALTFRSFDQLL
jgi:magnesium chelatase family protein